MIDRSRSLIIGINGQDGIYLSQILHSFGHFVVGVGTSSKINKYVSSGVSYFQCDVRDTSKLLDLIIKNEVQDVYNLAAISSVHQSFLDPLITLEVNYNAVERLLKALYSSQSQNFDQLRFFQASSSEMFGATLTEPQNEDTIFNPVSPYAISKVKALECCRRYRADGFHVSSAIMYNHESVHRSTQYVTRKISNTVAAIACGKVNKLKIGNLHAQRDWGYAFDFMMAASLILQQSIPDDYIVATGVVHSVHDLISMAFEEVGLGGKENEFVEIDEGLLRPYEITRLIGDFSKARKVLGWQNTKTFGEVFRNMVRYDLYLLGK